MSDLNSRNDLQEIDPNGIPVRASLPSRLKGLWFSRLSVLFLWMYAIYPLKGFRLLGMHFLKRAFFFTNGKVPMTNEQIRRQSIQMDADYLNREVDITPPKKMLESKEDG